MFQEINDGAIKVAFCFLITSEPAQQIRSADVVGQVVSNLEIVWTDQNLGRYMVNSLWIALSVTVCKTILSILVAMVLVYFSVRFKAVIFGFILFTPLMPTEVLILGLFDMVSRQPPQSFGEFL